MRLWQFLKVKELLVKKASDETILQEAGVTSTELTSIKKGDKLADVILLQDSDKLELCPLCGALTLYPCYGCFIKNLDPSIKTTEVISRPSKNRDQPINVSLESDLLDSDDENDFDDNYTI